MLGTAATDEATDDAEPFGWVPCDRFECGSLAVPLDHDDPEGPRISLAVVRLQASDPSKRIGPLLFNPGGPGASGRAFLVEAIDSIPAELTERFDLVSWDPRGVGASAPLDCGGVGAESATVRVDPSDLFAEYVDFLQRLGTACRLRQFDRLAHLGTVDGAHDLDLIRAALGEDRVSFVGYSYGTVLGTTYGELYPDRVRALVLDGAVAPDLDLLTDPVIRAESFETAFARMDRGCSLEPTCPVRQLGLTAHWDRLWSRAEEQPIPTSDPNGRLLTTDQLLLATLLPLYAPEVRESFAFGLADASGGDGSLLLLLADLFANRQADGTYPDAASIVRSVTCIDRHWSLPPEWTAELVSSAAETAPRFAGPVASSPLDCRWWPAAGHALPEFTGAGLGPVLIVGNTYDPATPFVWAQRLHETLPSSALLEAAIDGHTAFLSNGCVDRIVTRYLVDLAVPTVDRCAAPGFFGIIPADTDGGVQVVDVIPGSGAARAGVEPGDLLMAVDGHLVTRLRDVPEVSAGQRVELQVIRDAQVHGLDLTLGVRPYSTPVLPRNPAE